LKASPQILIVGAGFSGAVLARELAEAGHAVRLIDARPHLGGNCHTVRDDETGVMQHVYGPHIFNTSDAVVWEYVNRYAVMMPYINRVKASIQQGLFSFPINLHTINQFYNSHMDSDEARELIESVRHKEISVPKNFEEKALNLLGEELYTAFLKGYTIKQWGVDPKELPASILERLPIRFNYNDNYYDTTWQGIPRDGYTAMIESILNQPGIDISLNTSWQDSMRSEYPEVFYTGTIDAFYQYCHGKLGYRTVFWDKKVIKGDYQSNAVINYPEIHVPHTRIHEHKHFAPWESHEHSIVFTEFSKETGEGDIPYYPKRLADDKAMFSRYLEKARADHGVYFLGRLATYRYMDMDDVIGEALDLSKRYITWRANPKSARPKFGNDHEFED
jgi:UDP-galactopyranose mutase